MRYTLMAALLVLAGCSTPPGGEDAWGDAGADVAVGSDARNDAQAGDDAVPAADASDAAIAEDAGDAQAGEDAARADAQPDAPCPDADGDGHRASSCGGDDCDDADASRFPGAPEVCDGVDSNCDGAADSDPDNAGLMLSCRMVGPMPPAGATWSDVPRCITPETPAVYFSGGAYRYVRVPDARCQGTYSTGGRACWFATGMLVICSEPRP